MAKKKLGPLYNPLLPLSGQNLLKAARGLTNLEYGPQLTALSNQRKALDLKQQADTNWLSGQYGLASQRAAEIVKQMGQASTGATNVLSNTLAGIQSQATAEDNGLLDRARQDALLRGGGLSGGSVAAAGAESQAAAARAAAVGGAASDALANQNRAYEQLAQQSGIATIQRNNQSLGDLTARFAQARNDINAKGLQLNQQRGQTTLKNLLQLRRDAYDQYAVGAKLGLQQQTLAQNAAIASMKDRTTRRGQDKTAAVANARLDAYNQNINWQHQDRLARINQAAKAGNGAGLTPYQRRQLHKENTNIRGSIMAAASLIPSALNAKVDSADPNSKTYKQLGDQGYNQVLAGIAKKYFNNDLDLAKVAYSYHKNGGKLGPWAAGVLRAHGIGVPKSWRMANKAPSGVVLRPRSPSNGPMNAGGDPAGRYK